MKKYYKKFFTTKEFYEAMGKVTCDLDTQAMSDYIYKTNPKWFNVFTKNGEVITCKNFKQLLAVVKKKTDLAILDHLCFSRGKILHVFSSKDYFETETPKVEEEVVEETLEDTEVIEAVVEFDKEYALSLKDGVTYKQSKDDLEDYGKTFGIDLKKNKSFDNMLKDLIDHVGA